MNKKYLRISLAFALITVCIMLLISHSSYNRCSYPITTIESYAEVRELFTCTQSDTLILFDIDDTILQNDTTTGPLPESLPRSVDEWPWWFRLLLVIRHPPLLIPSNWEMLYSRIWEQTPERLTEPEVATLITQAQHSGCIVLGLSSIESGPYGSIPSFPEWRAAALCKVGITFTQKYPDGVFDSLPSYRSTKPKLYKGILCANQQPKGAVLQAFLETYKLRPSNIIFFDDTCDNLNSVGNVCSSLHIPCQLYRYSKPKYQQLWDSAANMQYIEKLLTEQATIDVLAHTNIIHDKMAKSETVLRRSFIHVTTIDILGSTTEHYDLRYI